MSPSKPKTDQKRTPRTTRTKSPPRFDLTARDVELVRVVLVYRFLSTHQFWWLFPDASEKNLTNRLRLLFQHGYLKRLKLPVSSSRDSMIYAMTEKGAKLIAETDNIERSDVKWKRYINDVQPTHVQHLLAVNDILITFRNDFEAAKDSGKLADYRVLRGDPKKHRLTVQVMDKRGHRQDVSVIPDAIVLLQPAESQHGVFFVEVDRGTMSTKQWTEKVAVYRDYIQSNKLLADWRSQWAILLAVTPSESDAPLVA